MISMKLLCYHKRVCDIRCVFAMLDCVTDTVIAGFREKKV